MASKQKSEDLRLQGNACVKEGKYSEAVMHYTHAIQNDSNNHLLYSNRSFAFLKMQQYYLAEEDAKLVIKLQPKWPKGYFRKGEVEFEVGHYTAAMISYGQAFMLDPTNDEVRQAVDKTNKQLLRRRKATARQPWLYCGCGSAVGLLIVLGDQYLAIKPSIQSIFLQLFLVAIFGVMGYIILVVYRYIKQSESNSLLEPPIDLLQEMGGGKKINKANPDTEAEADTSNQNGTTRTTHRKGGMGAARQRFKKGKT